MMSPGLMLTPVSASMRVRSFGVAQRVQSVLVQWTVHIDVAAQNQPDMFCDQLPEPGGPLVEGKCHQLGAEFA